ncbi:MAG: TIM barrel protein [Chloroflexi bacterium]|nr:TIM barrel protein [Chloroflexota bacterium]
MRVANAPCSWGVLEFELEGEIAPWRQVLDEMAETGYAGTELGDWGYLPTEPDILSRELASRGLRLVAGFVPLPLATPQAHRSNLALALRTARLLAQVGGERSVLVLADANGTVRERTLNAGRIVSSMGLSHDQWGVYAQGVEDIARIVLDSTGLRTAFHHHCGGYVETPAEIEQLMSRTDASLLGLCLDTGHAAYGGGHPLALLERYGPRVWHVHLKDMSAAVACCARERGWDYFRAVAEGVFCELGQGAVPFGTLTQNLRANGYDGWLVVEQDVLPSMGSPVASARRNHAYLRDTGVI